MSSTKIVKLSDMTKEYQQDLTKKMKDLKPVANLIFDKVRSVLDEGYNLTINFRQKSIERTIIKDIQYKGMGTKSTQVKDLYAARLIA
jgi:hypothetical protein